MKHKEDDLYFNTKNLISDLNKKSDLMNHYYGILLEEEKNMKTLQASLYFEIKNELPRCEDYSILMIHRIKV